jgi:hypothetical protein
MSAPDLGLLLLRPLRHVVRNAAGHVSSKILTAHHLLL